MNYAEDRLDRRSRQSNLLECFQTALKVENHARIADILRDLGWNDHAIFHYRQHGNNVADYAQMLELSGYPVSALIVLLQYRANELEFATIKSSYNHAAKKHPLPNDWLQQPYEKMRHRPCGCGNEALCGRTPSVWLSRDSRAYAALQSYLTDWTRRTQPPPSAAQIVRGVQQLEYQLPPLLQFWNDSNDDNFNIFSPLLCLLTIKILYLVIPILAMEVVLGMNFTKSQEEEFANSHKSHWAYYVFIKSIAFGERVKLSRKQYHTPVWDTFWKQTPNVEVFLSRLTLPCVDQEQPLFLWNNDVAVTPLYLVGDSHVLSLAWQTISIQNKSRLIVPVLVTGLKAWHVRSDTRFFTHTCFKQTLERLKNRTGTRTILLSAGEIDCREGMGGQLLEGYREPTHHVVETTARAYVNALCEHDEYWQILVLPVAPHLYRTKKGRHAAQVSRRSTMKVWNDTLHKLLPTENVFFLDYVNSVRLPGEEYVLNPIYNADSTHMNNGFLDIFEAAIYKCGCNLQRV